MRVAKIKLLPTEIPVGRVLPRLLGRAGWRRFPVLNFFAPFQFLCSHALMAPNLAAISVADGGLGLLKPRGHGGIRWPRSRLEFATALPERQARRSAAAGSSNHTAVGREVNIVRRLEHLANRDRTVATGATVCEPERHEPRQAATFRRLGPRLRAGLPKSAELLAVPRRTGGSPA